MLSPQLVLIAITTIMIGWNLLLAAIPCFLAYELNHWIKKRSWKKFSGNEKGIIVLAFLLWLFFFPNTAYLFTQVRHLVDECQDYNMFRVCVEEAWQVPFLFFYALLGVPTFVYGLSQMKKVFHTLFTQKHGEWLPIIVIPLTAFGVLFGLFERWNTWDIILKPWTIFLRAGRYVSDPVILLNLAVYTIVLFLIYYGTVYCFTKTKQRDNDITR